jgi:retron-type reverse transcriptase
LESEIGVGHNAFSSDRIIAEAISEHETQFLLDMTSRGLRYFCIACEVALLVVSVPLMSKIPLAGIGIVWALVAVFSIPVPLSAVLVYGVFAGCRRKEIIVDSRTKTVTLKVMYGALVSQHVFVFDAIDAILLESEDGGAPPGVVANYYEAFVTLVLILANGRKMRLIRSVRLKPPPRDVALLHYLLVNTILIGTGRPVVYLSEHIRVVKSPGADGETAIEINVHRIPYKAAFIIFMIITASALTLANLAFYTMLLPYPNLHMGMFILLMNALLMVPLAPFAIYFGIKYALDYTHETIDVNNNNGFLRIFDSQGMEKLALSVQEIERVDLATERTGSRKGIAAYQYWPRLKVAGGRDIKLYHSDRFFEASSLQSLLQYLIRHAQYKATHPEAPPLPLLTHDALNVIMQKEHERKEDLGRARASGTANMLAWKKRQAPAKSPAPGQPRFNNNFQFSVQVLPEAYFRGEKFNDLLKNTVPDATKLDRYNLPHLATWNELAAFFGIAKEPLQAMADIKLSIAPHEDHYYRFVIPKAGGKHRNIYAPKKDLRVVQKKIYLDILKKVPIHERAHGFRPGRSIVTNAREHLGAAVVCHFDIKDFFPSIHGRRILDCFRELGYSGFTSVILTSFCSVAKRRFKNGQREMVRIKPLSLPQGACTSPALSNLVCLKMDQELEDLAKQRGFTYTRYADDIIFSTTNAATVPKTLDRVIRNITVKYNLGLNSKKKSLKRKNARQLVTGIVVNNNDPALPRWWIRNLRAALHNLETGKIDPVDKASKIKEIEGSCHYAVMVNPARYRKYLAKFKTLNNTKQTTSRVNKQTQSAEERAPVEETEKPSDEQETHLLRHKYY